METIEQKLAEILRQIEKQDTDWDRAKEELMQQLGDASLYVPDGVLREIDEACTPRAQQNQTIHGMRA